MPRLMRWWQTIIKPEPVQLDLPFWCGFYGETCTYFNDGTAFYGRCTKCRSQYDPVNDR